MVSRDGVVGKRAQSASDGSSRPLVPTISYRKEHHCIVARRIGKSIENRVG
jgi:hypothetical protein